MLGDGSGQGFAAKTGRELEIKAISSSRNAHGMAFTLGEAHLFLGSWTGLFQATASASW